MELIILDRDGVINSDTNDYIKSAAEWQPIPGSLEAIGRLCRHGYRIAVATNQAGIALGRMTVEDLTRIHQRMHTQLANHGGLIDAVFFCPHAPESECGCRKPAPGMLQAISQRLRMPLDTVIMVGDKPSDIQAAEAAGCKPVLVRTGYGQASIDAGRIAASVPVYNDLAGFVETLLPE